MIGAPRLLRDKLHLLAVSGLPLLALSLAIPAGKDQSIRQVGLGNPGRGALQGNPVAIRLGFGPPDAAVLPGEGYFAVELDAADQAVRLQEGGHRDRRGPARVRVRNPILGVARPEGGDGSRQRIEPLDPLPRARHAQAPGAQAGIRGPLPRIWPRPEREEALPRRVARLPGHCLHPEERHVAGVDAVQAVNDRPVEPPGAPHHAEAALFHRLVDRNGSALFLLGYLVGGAAQKHAPVGIGRHQRLERRRHQRHGGPDDAQPACHLLVAAFKRFQLLALRRDVARYRLLTRDQREPQRLRAEDLRANGGLAHREPARAEAAADTVVGEEGRVARAIRGRGQHDRLLGHKKRHAKEALVAVRARRRHEARVVGAPRRQVAQHVAKEALQVRVGSRREIGHGPSDEDHAARAGGVLHDQALAAPRHRIRQELARWPGWRVETGHGAPGPGGEHDGRAGGQAREDGVRAVFLGHAQTARAGFLGGDAQGRRFDPHRVEERPGSAGEKHASTSLQVGEEVRGAGPAKPRGGIHLAAVIPNEIRLLGGAQPARIVLPPAGRERLHPDHLALAPRKRQRAALARFALVRQREIDEGDPRARRLLGRHAMGQEENRTEHGGARREKHSHPMKRHAPVAPNPLRPAGGVDVSHLDTAPTLGIPRQGRTDTDGELPRAGLEAPRAGLSVTTEASDPYPRNLSPTQRVAPVNRRWGLLPEA